jgi:anti-anti-sigma factor
MLLLTFGAPVRAGPRLAPAGRRVEALQYAWWLGARRPDTYVMDDHSSESSLRVDTLTDGDRTVVVVRGDVDARTAPQVAAVVDALTEDVRVIEFDFDELGFLDSTGLGMIAAAIRRVEPLDGKVVLTSVPPIVVRLLEITDLARFVAIEPTRSV